MSDADILVTGATGRTGGAAIDELLSMGRRVRALVRSDDGRAQALRDRGVEIAIGDFGDLDALRAAMDGIRSAYFLYPIRPGIIEATAYFAQAAREAEVKAIVNMSQISARREAKSNAARDHWISERVFDWSGIPTSHLRPTFFADWLTMPSFGTRIWAEKRIELPFADARHAPISSDDQGRVIAHILASPAGHEGAIYPLFGPVEMDQRQVASTISDVLGEQITYHPISLEEWDERLTKVYQFPPVLAQHLSEVARDYRAGVFSGTNDVVERITGKAPLSVADFVKRHRAVFA